MNRFNHLGDSVAYYWNNFKDRVKNIDWKKVGKDSAILTFTLALAYSAVKYGTACTQKDINNVVKGPKNMVVETKPEKTALELELEKIVDRELKSKIENELKNTLYFKNDENKIKYVLEVINMNQEGMMINYLFDNDYFNEFYNPNQKINWVKSFDKNGFDEFMADALLIKLNEAENKLDADGDNINNLSEVSGNYQTSTGPALTTSSPLNPLDPPQ